MRASHPHTRTMTLEDLGPARRAVTRSCLSSYRQFVSRSYRRPFFFFKTHVVYFVYARRRLEIRFSAVESVNADPNKSIGRRHTCASCRQFDEHDARAAFRFYNDVARVFSDRVGHRNCRNVVGFHAGLSQIIFRHSNSDRKQKVEHVSDWYCKEASYVGYYVFATAVKMRIDGNSAIDLLERVSQAVRIILPGRFSFVHKAALNGVGEFFSYFKKRNRHW